MVVLGGMLGDNLKEKKMIWFSHLCMQRTHQQLGGWLNS